MVKQRLAEGYEHYSHPYLQPAWHDDDDGGYSDSEYPWRRPADDEKTILCKALEINNPRDVKKRLQQRGV